MESIKNSENNTIKNIFVGVGISFIFTIIALIIFSVVLTYTNVQENVINPVIMIITAISILLGSSIGNAKIKKNGLINGGIVGGIYILLIYLISSILNWRFSLNVQSIIMISVSIIFGILGGIIGVNKKWLNSKQKGLIIAFLSLFVEMFLLTKWVLGFII